MEGVDVLLASALASFVYLYQQRHHAIFPSLRQTAGIHLGLHGWCVHAHARTCPQHANTQTRTHAQDCVHLRVCVQMAAVACVDPEVCRGCARYLLVVCAVLGIYAGMLYVTCMFYLAGHVHSPLLTYPAAMFCLYALQTANIVAVFIGVRGKRACSATPGRALYNWGSLMKPLFLLWLFALAACLAAWLLGCLCGVGDLPSNGDSPCHDACVRVCVCVSWLLGIYALMPLTSSLTTTLVITVRLSTLSKESICIGLLYFEAHLYM